MKDEEQQLPFGGHEDHPTEPGSHEGDGGSLDHTKSDESPDPTETTPDQSEDGLSVEGTPTIEVSDEPPTEHHPPRWLVPTNRYNLLEFLSGRLIVPYQGLSKYYQDFLIESPGRIPVIADGIGASIAAHLSREDETAFPVLIELSDMVTCDADVPALAASGSADLPFGDPAAVAWAPAGVLELQRVKAVHFRSEAELREHSARRYANIHGECLRFEVTPALFNASNLPADVLSAFLRTLPPVKNPDQDAFRAADRVSGALAIIATSLAPDGVSLPAFAKLLDGARKAAGGKYWPQWIVGGRLSNWSKDRRRKHDLDSLLFENACEAVLAIDPADVWRPTELLDRVTEHALDSLEDEERAELLTNLTPIREILRNERDAKPFRPGHGLASAKALLLFLQRPQPDRIVTWRDSDLTPDYPELVAACALSGLLHGRRLTPITHRPETLDHELAKREAQWLSALNSSAGFASPSVEPTHLKETTSLFVSEIDLHAGDEVLVSQINPRSATDILLDIDLTDPSLVDIGREVAEAAGWEDCLTVVVTLPRTAYSVAKSGETATLTLVGPHETQRGIDPDLLRRRLAADELPALLDSELRTMVVQGLVALEARSLPPAVVRPQNPIAD